MQPKGIVVWSDCADENVKARYFAELVRRFVCPVDRRGLTGNTPVFTHTKGRK